MQPPMCTSELMGWPASHWPSLRKLDEEYVYIRIKKRYYKIPFELALRPHHVAECVLGNMTYRLAFYSQIIKKMDHNLFVLENVRGAAVVFDLDDPNLRLVRVIISRHLVWDYSSDEGGLNVRSS